MARPKKPVELQRKNLTKQEIEQKKLEESLVNITAKNVKCPSFIKSEIAINEFERLVGLLEEIDILTELDITMLGNYCNCYSRFVEVSQQLDKEDLTIEYTNKAGFTNAIENPKFKVLLKLSKELRDLGNELGINMSSRLKFATIKAEKLNNELENEFGEL